MSNFTIISSTSSYIVPSENSDTSIMRKPGMSAASRKPFNDILVNSKSQLKGDELVKPKPSLEVEELLKPKPSFKMNDLPNSKTSLEEEELLKPRSTFKMDEQLRPKSPFNKDELFRPISPLKVDELPRSKSPLDMDIDELLKPKEAPKSNLRKKLAMIDRDMSLEQFLYVCEPEPVYDVVWDEWFLIGAENLISVLDNYYKFRSCTPMPYEDLETIPRPKTPDFIKLDFPCFCESSLEPPIPNEFYIDDLELSDLDDIGKSS